MKYENKTVVGDGGSDNTLKFHLIENVLQINASSNFLTWDFW
jgi:hypothetical protein